jgi:hypothetical protein
MIKGFKNYWEEKPLLLIFWLAFLLRLFSSVFSQGVLGEDISGTIDYAYFLSKGYDNYSIFPWNHEVASINDNNYFLLIIHYLVFGFLDLLNISDVKVKILIIRILYSFVSLITVYFGYRLTKLLVNQRFAKIVAFILAVFWILPFLNSKTFSITLCLPFLLMGLYYYAKYEKTLQSVYYLSTGIMFGIALSLSYSAIFFIIPFLVLFFVLKKLINFFHLITGLFLSFFMFTGLIDFFIWGQPFLPFFQYISNILKLSFFEVINIQLSLMILIFSTFIFGLVVLFTGLIKSFIKYYIYIVPSLIFFIFQFFTENIISYNSFITLPLLIIFGIIGWLNFIESKKITFPIQKNLRLIYLIGLVSNFIIFIFFSTSFTNKAKVESTYYIGNNISNNTDLLIINSNEDFFADYYFGKNVNKTIYKIESKSNNLKYSGRKVNLNSEIIFSLDFFNFPDNEYNIEYILIYGETNHKNNIEEIKNYFPYCELIKVFEISSFDAILNYFGAEIEEVYLYSNE